VKRLAFGDDMMRAIDCGAKSMTRRPEKHAVPADQWQFDAMWSIQNNPVLVRQVSDTLGEQLGSRLRVGELVAATCAYVPVVGFYDTGADYLSAIYRFRTTGEGAGMQFKTSRVMPAALAPFVLRITSVKAEQLGEITNEDAKREGAVYWSENFNAMSPIEQRIANETPREGFAMLWDWIYGAGAWNDDAQKWVWVYGFEIAERRV
jgi:hypothetical protein